MDESDVERDFLRIETDRLTKAYHHDLNLIHEATAASMKELERHVKQLKNEERIKIRKRERRLQGQLDQLRAAAPIRKLPTEILSYIFQFYVLHDIPPWCLMKVCKRWKQLALMTPQLWCRIRLTDVNSSWDGIQITVVNSIRDGKPPSKYSLGSLGGVTLLSWGNTLICRSTAQFQVAVRHSAAVPLEVTIAPRSGTQSACQTAMSAISSLITEPMSNRIESLVIDFPSITDISATLNVALGRFTLLKNIEIYGQSPALVVRLFQAISLTSTCLKRVGTNCRITPELAKLSIWSRIKAVLLQTPRGRRSIAARDLNKISEKLANLDRFTQIPWSWPDQDTPTGIWRNISKIDLACDSIHLGRIELPALKTLKIIDIRDWRNEGNDITIFPLISFPLLNHMNVATSRPGWLSKVSAPLLKELIIDRERHGWHGESSSLFIGVKFPSVRDLTFGRCCTSGVAISGVTVFSKIRKLSLLFGDKETILSFLFRLGTVTPILCPHLKRLRLGNVDYRVVAFKKDIVPKLKLLIKSRKSLGKPLLELSVCWSRDGGTAQAFISPHSESNAKLSMPS